MSNDRELLELAAKAIGLKIGPNPWKTPGLNWAVGITWFEDSYSPGVHTLTGSDRDGPISDVWNPGRDDGDCARMEANLLMSVEFFEGGVTSTSHDGNTWSKVLFVHCKHDRNAARRMASLKVAAGIGKAMP